jgi:putative acetyltransferase
MSTIRPASFPDDSPRSARARRGRALAEAILSEARRIGYSRMRLDTLPSMAEAIVLYQRLGFSDIAPYRHTPVPGARFLERTLNEGER